MEPQALDLELRPSRLRRGATLAIVVLALLVAPAQALRLEAPWPLLLLPALAFLPRLFPERVPARLRLAGPEVDAVFAAGPRSGRLDGPAAVTALTVELPVRWHDGARERLVVWRDAVDDAAFRRLARSVRRPRPVGEAV